MRRTAITAPAPCGGRAHKGLDAVALRLLDIGGVDVDGKESVSGTSALWCACAKGLDVVALRLLDIDGVDVDAKDSGIDTTPLWWACHNGLGEVALRLLDIGGVDVDAMHRFDGTNVVWQAFNSELHEVVNKLRGMTSNIDPRYLDPGLISHPSEKCPICFGDFTTNTLVRSISRLECGHIFDNKCIHRWENTQKSRNIEVSCPLCRSKCTDQGIDQLPVRRTIRGDETLFSLYPTLRL